MPTLTDVMTPQEYLKALKPLSNPEEIQTLCQQLTDCLFNETDKPKTRVNKLTPYNKLVNTIPNEELVEGENAYIQTKQDGTLWKRHLHFKFTGLADTKWNGEGGINTKTVVLDRLENRRQVNVKQYLETTLKLLQSDDPHELAVGLIAASGRRPVEILARGSFTLAIKLPPYLKPGYFVNFRGQAKKRDYDIPADERAEYRIGVLISASFFIQSFQRFRAMPQTKEILDLVKAQTKKGTDPEVVNEMVESRRGNSLRRVVSQEFSSFLPARFGESEVNNKSLRAVYVRLITDRDCPRNIADLLWASRSIGHFIDFKQPDDSQLKHLLTTVGYSDYYASSPVPFIESPQKQPREKISQVRTTTTDTEIIKALQDKLNLPNQQAVIRYLIERDLQVEKLERQLHVAQDRIAELEKQKEITEKMQPTQPTTQPQANDVNESLESEVEAIVLKVLERVLPQKAQVNTVPATVSSSKPKAVKPEKDWSSMTTDELKASRNRGATDERIYRAFRAICEYNDAQPSNEGRWFVGNVTLRDLSGCNGLLVKDWMERHQISIFDHNQKYGLGQYHNKRHKGVEIGDVVKW